MPCKMGLPSDGGADAVMNAPTSDEGLKKFSHAKAAERL